jgi:hypothetical protein
MFSVSIPTLSTSSTDFSSLLFRLVMHVLEVLDPIKSITLKDTNVTFENIDGRPFYFRREAATKNAQLYRRTTFLTV